jgi:hypothetical protein
LNFWRETQFQLCDDLFGDFGLDPENV